VSVDQTDERHSIEAGMLVKARLEVVVAFVNGFDIVDN